MRRRKSSSMKARTFRIYHLKLNPEPSRPEFLMTKGPICLQSSKITRDYPTMSGSKPLGWKLLAAKLITEPQLKEPWRGRKRKGKARENLNELGFLTLDRFSRFLKKHPMLPRPWKDGTGTFVPGRAHAQHILFLAEFKFGICGESELPVGSSIRS